jgi:hypothetical protein
MPVYYGTDMGIEELKDILCEWRWTQQFQRRKAAQNKKR